MTGESSAQESAQAYALERYYAQFGGPLMGIMTGGVSTIMAAAKSVQAASEAGALQHDPEAVDSAIKKLEDFEAVLGKIQRKAGRLATKTPLGGGYADQIGKINERIGEAVRSEVIPDLINAIGELKAQLDKSRKSYRNVEESTSGTLEQL
ncbi:hypothetical protein SK571_38335 [Lentzea sp. BCCO 10_0798]|uniref:Excreted virulence factor EspC, type VII ESX diderm n=1 Tax=Lentzea kristufekii TaxID=3095430 RepID=A0ABU4U3X2_9PSEU|nr:hypothetical protein [Lentzea sp. BCCO 10_0798]MDX8055267.1 hypothetical protein [Lentzea sp. BCCO 10_0798]